jgi:hypothetical protein
MTDDNSAVPVTARDLRVGDVIRWTDGRLRSVDTPPETTNFHGEYAEPKILVWVTELNADKAPAGERERQLFAEDDVLQVLAPRPLRGTRSPARRQRRVGLDGVGQLGGVLVSDEGTEPPLDPFGVRVGEFLGGVQVPGVTGARQQDLPDRGLVRIRGVRQRAAESSVVAQFVHDPVIDHGLGDGHSRLLDRMGWPG